MAIVVYVSAGVIMLCVAVPANAFTTANAARVREGLFAGAVSCLAVNGNG